MIVAEAVAAAPARLGAVRLLAIDGPSGAGKSTFAAAVCSALRARSLHTELISTDEFATWTDPVAWWPRLRDGVLREFAAGRPGRYRRTVWPDGVPRLGDQVTVAVPEVLVLEGVSAARASARRWTSHVCWLPGPDAETRLDRAAGRDGEWSRPELKRWQEFERGWFAIDLPRLHADTSFGAVQMGYFD